MLATVTDKGQVTVPKAIRDRIGIVPGSRLDFELMSDGSLRVRVLAHGADNLFGLLQRPGIEAQSIEAMDAGIAAAARDRNAQAKR
ncbi:AbrB/MazE/SpoVT family DNA-binding domain-containing protein [Sulfuricystis multivorans]|uniref:AbrB/MazE/SpoVT family DNA-binding domain-containing protein n=1 Tax=Sulfuricystis multivorans TaxID=2211108 RepID=UPI0015597609|nr:AbrB/MazE/SpoVT family DNA-binding domain-containing protein [Sulfuricystis multivorans]